VYLAEGEVLSQWPMLDAAELRRARKKSLLTHYAFLSGVCYKSEDVEDYIRRTYKRCASGKSEASTSNARFPIAKSVNIVCIRANDERWLISVGPRGCWKCLWNFGTGAL